MSQITPLMWGRSGSGEFVGYRNPPKSGNSSRDVRITRAAVPREEQLLREASVTAILTRRILRRWTGRSPFVREGDRARQGSGFRVYALNADAKLNRLLGLDAGVVLDEPGLHFYRTVHRVDDNPELDVEPSQVRLTTRP